MREHSTHFVLVGVNHKTAPIGLREKVAIGRDELAEATRSLAGMPGVLECMIVSTCNRVELLAVVAGEYADPAEFLFERFAVDRVQLRPHLYEYRERDAVRHLFRVASSLDSMVLGESQILGQVKEAFAVARAAGSSSICCKARLRQRKKCGQKRRSARIRFRLPRWLWIWRARFSDRSRDALCSWWAQAK